MPITKREILDDEDMRITLSTGKVLILRYQDTMTRVLVVDEETGEQRGNFDFRVREEELGNRETAEVARLVHAFNEQYTRQGIGTEAVKWFLFQHCISPSALELPEHDGHRREDGSHLTGLGPAFIASLERKRAAGLLADDYDGI
ncbi:hypothetical protein J2W32_000949 [Variovorax boronicumulans]|uniref:N-acetyltransferase n=1 Tax=Variovorax boronicumulans TaxID=436515 RepID=A0AAW8CXJ6_9BURK|nr:hypothetical protein [Variovorax boronicumulans]MDP9892606.1 hypothetical protein [Variovorax boronicumulans]MDQ0051913.1 hypothetical protein [Variovorax boronicumulans]